MSQQNKNAKAYARALFQSALNFRVDTNFLQQSNVITIGEEISLIRSLILNSLKLRTLITNQIILDTQKLDILFSFFPKMSVLMQSFLRVLAEKSQLSNIFSICEEYHKIVLKFNSMTTVRLFFANSLEEAQGVLLLTSLKKLTASKDIILRPIFSPRLLGGLVLEYNSKAIDASVVNEMNRLL